MTVNTLVRKLRRLQRNGHGNSDIVFSVNRDAEIYIGKKKVEVIDAEFPLTPVFFDKENYKVAPCHYDRFSNAIFIG